MRQDRWVKPLSVEPGHWKQQLRTKHLKLGSSNNLPRLKQLLKQKPNFLNQAGPHGRTFLFEAIRRGRKRNVEWLLTQGSDANLSGCYNNESMVQLNGLGAARYYQRPEIEDLLKSNNAAWNIWNAAFCHESNILETYLGEHPELLNLEDPSDEIYYHTPLAFAIAGGNLYDAQLLYDKGAELLPYGVQFLFKAARIDRLDIVAWLIDQGVQATDADATLWMSTNNLTILEKFIDIGLTANQKRYSNLTPLHYVCRGDKGEHTEKLELLLQIGAIVNAIGPKGRTAAHYAVLGGFADSVRLLIDSGADLSIRDEDGCTALDLAQKMGINTVIDVLTS